MKIYLLCQETNWQRAAEKKVVAVSVSSFSEKKLKKKTSKLSAGGTLAHTVYYTETIDCSPLRGIAIVMGKRQ